MENVVEALKMAFGYMMFVLALTLTISSFSLAREATDAVITIKDRETQYTYIEPASDFNNIVGIETVLPTMYKAYKENFKIVFYKSYTDENNNEPFILYKYKEKYGTKEIPVNYVDLEKEVFANAEEAIEHLNILLNKRSTDPNSKYYDQFEYPDGLYNELKGQTFKQLLGEYYQEDVNGETNTIEANKTKKRVITYILQQP